ncbi:MAG: efflux transporter outer membrane subunit [Pseudomonadota bacterium]|nr:efflux transporter outer membrane subunit [Pseudomonadota bacterium]MED5423648.1 efflux transporter outer membrane subunit [Pseudomonadota bacterium]
MMKKLILVSTMLTLSGCGLVAEQYDLSFDKLTNWRSDAAAPVEQVSASSLKDWWQKFEDPALNELVTQAMSSSPDRLIAEARIAEARGLRRSARGSLLPQISASGSGGREDTGLYDNLYPDNFYDAGFDASFELDVFGKNRNNFSASDNQLRAAEEQYRDVTLSLIAEISRNYIEYRAAQHQLRIAQKNLATQEKTLTLIEDMFRLGAAPKLDVERANNLVNTTRASLPEYQRQADNARLALTVLVGALPQDLEPVLAEAAEIPATNIAPVLIAPAEVLSRRPDVQAASYLLAANTDLTQAAAADIFPSFTLRGFYGVADNALASAINPWNIALGAAVSLLDFGRIEGRVDAAKAREKQSFEQYRKTVLSAVSEVETALTDYIHINGQHQSLEQAYDSASKAFDLSQNLYKEGEIAFLDVLDSQRTVNNAESAMITAKASEAVALTRLYKALGVY